MVTIMRQPYQQVFFLPVDIDCINGIVRFVFCTYLPLPLKTQNSKLDRSDSPL